MQRFNYNAQLCEYSTLISIVKPLIKQKILLYQLRISYNYYSTSCKVSTKETSRVKSRAHNITQKLIMILYANNNLKMKYLYICIYI